METPEAADRALVRAAGGMWWLFLVTGVVWVLLSMLVLRFNTTSITTVGVLIGVLFLVAALNEFVIATFKEDWRWLHIVLGALFAIASLWGFFQPEEAFWALASVLGLLLVLKGTFDIIVAVVAKDYNDLWWLGLVVGILEVLLGFWASQQLYPARAALILIWVGLFCLFRGIMEIVLAFGIRKAGKELASA